WPSFRSPWNFLIAASRNNSRLSKWCTTEYVLQGRDRGPRFRADVMLAAMTLNGQRAASRSTWQFIFPARMQSRLQLARMPALLRMIHLERVINRQRQGQGASDLIRLLSVAGGSCRSFTLPGRPAVI